MRGVLVRAREERGAAAVEFALVLLPLLYLVFGIVQYGLYFWAYQGGADAARSAARLSAVGDPADCASFRTQITGQVRDVAGTVVPGDIDRTYQQRDPARIWIGDTVAVTVKFRSVDLHLPFIPFLHDGWVVSTAHARVDYVPPGRTLENCS